MLHLAFAIAALLLASPAVAQQREAIPVRLHLALVAYAAANGADLATTMHALGAGTARERNPLLTPFVGTPLVAGLVKGGAAAAASWLLIREHRRHPRLAC